MKHDPTEKRKMLRDFATGFRKARKELVQENSIPPGKPKPAPVTLNPEAVEKVSELYQVARKTMFDARCAWPWGYRR